MVERRNFCCHLVSPRIPIFMETAFKLSSEYFPRSICISLVVTVKIVEKNTKWSFALHVIKQVGCVGNSVLFSSLFYKICENGQTQISNRLHLTRESVHENHSNKIWRKRQTSSKTQVRDRDLHLYTCSLVMGGNSELKPSTFLALLQRSDHRSDAQGQKSHQGTWENLWSYKNQVFFFQGYVGIF